MIAFPWKKSNGPLGVDFGTASVKLVQLGGDGAQLVDAARWDLPGGEGGDANPGEQLKSALDQARKGRKFTGRDAVVCLGGDDLFVQNVRVNKADGEMLDGLVHQEAAAKLPFSVAEAEIRFLEAADVRQGEQVMREVILLACHRPRLEQLLGAVESAGLNPIAVDVEPAAMLRCYASQYRRDADRQQRTMLLRIGHSSSIVMIAEGERVLFLKYLDLGGRDFDQAVAKHLSMKPHEAIALRRHNGDRRADQQDPEIADSIAVATRPVIESLVSELSMCIRYHSVTFRGQPLARLVLSGGEASDQLAELLGKRLDLRTEVGQPMRTFETSGAQAASLGHRSAQWDVATGLALREVTA